MPVRLDQVDCGILRELQGDGRMTNVELAGRVGISAPACLRRVRALEQAGFITGFRALLDEKRLGFDVTVFAMVHLSSQAEADLKAFEDFVRGEPLVRECWMLSGEIDFILKCVAPNLATFQAFVQELTAAPHVRNVKTSLTLRNSKDAAMVPMELVGQARELVATTWTGKSWLLIIPGVVAEQHYPRHSCGWSQCVRDRSSSVARGRDGRFRESRWPTRLQSISVAPSPIWLPTITTPVRWPIRKVPRPTGISSRAFWRVSTRRRFCPETCRW